MKKNTLKIKTNVSSAIFVHPIIHSKEEQLYNINNQTLIERIDEILNYAELTIHNELSHENIIRIFKSSFRKFVLSKAITQALLPASNYNILEALYNMLSDDVFKEAIYGETLIDSICYAIRTSPIYSTTDPIIYGSKILLIRKRYL